MGFNEILTCIVIGILIFVIPVFIYSILTKNKNNFKPIITMSCINSAYLLLAVFLLPNIFPIEGWGTLALQVSLFKFACIAWIGYFVSFCICLYRKRNLTDKPKTMSYNVLKCLLVVFTILPIILLIIGYYKQQVIIKDEQLLINEQTVFANNADLIIKSNYQSGFINSEDHWYVVSGNTIKEIKKQAFEKADKADYKELVVYRYTVRFDNNNYDDINISSYNDSNLIYINTETVSNIIKDIINNRIKLPKEIKLGNYVEMIDNITEIYIEYLHDSDYYIVTSIGDSWLISEMIYKNDSYIGEQNITGDIKTVLYRK